MRPGLAGVGGFVDAVADRKIGPMQSLAAADINDVGIGRSNCDGADGLRGLVIEDGIPGAAVVVRLPDAAVHLADVKHIRLAGNSRGGAGAPATKRPDHAPVQILISVFGNLRPACSSSQKNDEAHQQTKNYMRSVHLRPLRQQTANQLRINQKRAARSVTQKSLRF